MVLKRKYGSRYDWKRIMKSAYTELFIEMESFKGYVSLFHMKEVREPLFMRYDSRAVCVVEDGYYWMQHFPEGQHYSVTTVIDSSGSIVQWYIDICKRIGYSTEHGPWMDDLYLDLIVLPTGEIIEKDIDELELALKNGEISTIEYEMAWAEFLRLKNVLLGDYVKLEEMTTSHFELLVQTLNERDD